MSFFSADRPPPRLSEGWHKVLAIACVLVAILIGASSRGSAQTNAPTSPDTTSLATTSLAPTSLGLEIKGLKGEIASLAADVEAQAKSFKSLLDTRGRADVLIQRARTLAREAEDAQSLAQHRAEPTVPGATTKDSSKSDTVDATASVRSIEMLRERITDLRRRQLNGRIYAASYSPFSPAFWFDIIHLSLSTTQDQWAELQGLWQEHASNDLVLDTVVMAIVVVVLLALVAILRRTIAKRLMAPLATQSGRLSRRSLMLRALVRLFLSALLVPITLIVLAMVDRQLDFAPDELDPFFTACILVWAGVSLGSTALRLALQPDDERVRLVPMTDRQAKVLYRCGLALMLIYGLAIALDELQSALHILVAISAATTMIWVVACGLCMAWALSGLRRFDDWAGATALDLSRDPDAPETAASGRTAIVPIASALYHRRFFLGLEICAWSVITISTVGVLTGYLALAGFVMGRFIVTILFWTLAYIFLKSIDVLLTPERSQGKSEPLLARLMVPNSETSDLLSVIGAGLLRVAIILPMIFVTLGPWHLEYGELNPFQDAFVGLNLAELRDAVGSVGFATICLFLGLGATKILTSWLDGSLLPYTKLDAGVRYSLTTIIGYAGICLSIILCLSQLGISPQSLTVIASTLSVGIGFGLQSIVSNFVSGLIVLTERRVRVGDVISVKGEEGRVRKINVRSTLISTGDNVDLIVPNTDLITSIVRNKTLNDPRSRLRLPLVVRQDADIRALCDIVLGVTYHHPNVMTDPQPTIVMTKPSQIGLEFEVVCLLVDETKGGATRSDLYLQWIDHFREQGIFLAQDPTPATP